jgi:DNA-binding LacI/PurR family transcriptional regulator
MANVTSKRKSEATRERVRKHREALRASGLRPVTHWVPDTRNPEFVAAYRKEREALAKSSRENPEREAEYWAWANAVQADEGWV